MYFLSKNIARQIDMNPTNYPITICVNDTGLGYNTTEYWLGINLSTTALVHFQEWLSDELNIAMNDRYPDSPFPLAIRNFQIILDGEEQEPQPVRWNHACICFLQAQARKIQKFLFENRCQVAVPCAELVE